MIKQIAMSILLASSSGIACAAPAPHVRPHEGFFYFFGSIFEQTKHDQDAPVAAPEMDPASAISGFTLLVGGVAVIVAGRRRNAAQA